MAHCPSFISEATEEDGTIDAVPLLCCQVALHIEAQGVVPRVTGPSIGSACVRPEFKIMSVADARYYAQRNFASSTRREDTRGLY